jgi:hypothetical protein|tara:strand:- start:1865 stop:3058 length:1194 start_codon:yes stop_codon:yes gene_type:complete
MAENENVTEQVTQIPEETGKLKIKKPTLKNFNNDEVIKVDLSKPKNQENEVKEDNPVDKGVATEPNNAESTEKQKEVQPEVEAQETPVLEEIIEEVKEDTVEEKVVEDLAEKAQEAMIKSAETGKALPENLQKVVDFMEETGGNIEDYVRLNQDYSSLDENNLLKEYYKQTKSHLTSEEINFLIEDDFSISEDDSERDKRKKKIALKEQVADAKTYLDGLKSKYYEEIKAGSRLTPEAKTALDFYNKYNKESEETQKVASQQKNTFLEKTDKVFNDEFKGFEYSVGDKKYRFNVKNGGEIKQTQSDINNFVKKFLDKDGVIGDAKGYHKSLFTAMNADAIANHFYEQGKADATKTSIEKAKNINMNPRQTFSNESGKVKYRVIGDNSSNFKLKLKQK